MTTTQPSTDPAAATPALAWWRLTWQQSVWETRLALGHAEQLLLSVLLPAIALVGLSQSTVIDLGTPPGVDRVAYLLPGVLALAVLSSSFTGQAIATGFDRRAGVLLFLATTPLGKPGFVLGRVGSTALVQVVQCVVLCAVSAALGYVPSVSVLATMLPALALGSCALTACGLALAGTIRAEATLAVANVLWVISAGAGVLLPPSTLPALVAPVVSWLPATALANALRDASLAHHVDVFSLGVLVAWLVVGVAGMRWFRWTP